MSVAAAPKVVIAGGGVAGVTALMALADLGEHGLDIDVVAPVDDFVLRAQVIGAPWGGPPVRVALAELAAQFGATFRRATLQRVDADEQVIVTSDGHNTAYHAALIATGAVPSVAYSGVRTVGFGGGLPPSLASPDRGTVAIIVPPGTGWTLPAYQLALMVAASGRAEVRVVTPELQPLEVFGPVAAEAASAFLIDHDVHVELGHTFVEGAEEPFELADTVLSLPLLRGPGVAGLPRGADGFLPVDENQQVRGVPGVYAAGDVTTCPIKQGGLAAFGAERAALAIAASAGSDPALSHERPTLRGKLVAGEHELYLRRVLDDADRGRAHHEPLWKPEAAMLAWRLSRWLLTHPAEGRVDALGPLAHPA